MNKFIIEKNDFLSRNIPAFYNKDYVGYGRPNNPDFINILKNTYNNYSVDILKNAVNELENVLNDIFDIAYTHAEFNFDWPLTVCIIPRAKNNYSKNQLLFHSTIQKFVRHAVDDLDKAQYHEILDDGTDYIIRHSTTKTTHLPTNTPNYNNDGDSPYIGITKATCHISEKVKGKSILLIDDIYTKNVNIDEDAIQALLDNGAKSVLFYAVAKTIANRTNI